MMNQKWPYQMRNTWIAAGIAVLTLLVPSSRALAGADYYGYINYYQGGAMVSADFDGSDESSVSYQSASGGVGTGWSISAGESIAFAGGHADAANHNLGIYAQVISTPENNTFSDAMITTEVSNRLTVLPGSSGLSLGDLTRLTLRVRVDGSLHTEATSYPKKGWASAQVDADLAVHDYQIQIGGGEDGYWSPPQASFGASCSLDSSDVYKPVWNYSYASNWDKSWSIDSNISERDSYSNSGKTTETGDSFHYQQGLSLDTGELSVTLEAIVGHTLDFDASLYVYANANNNGMSWADFDNTMVFDVTSADGASLNWAIAPEPATLLLLGMGGLLLSRKK
jgi:hypothetical protein